MDNCIVSKCNVICIILISCPFPMTAVNRLWYFYTDFELIYAQISLKVLCF